MNFTDYLGIHERSRPTRTAVSTGETSWTYRELVDDVRSFANVLDANGVTDEDRTAVMLPNTYEFVVSFLGGLSRGALTGLIDPQVNRRELGSLLETISPEVVVTTPEKADAVRALDREATVFSPGGPASPGHDLRAAVDAASSEYRIPETFSSREALVLHTSGSTGQPKAVVHTHDTLIKISDLAAIGYELCSGTTSLAALPLCHCWGLMNLGATLKLGGETVLLDEWDPETVTDRIDRFAVDVFAGVPTMFKDLLAAPDTDGWTPASLDVAITGGAGVSTDLIRESEALLGCPVLNGWGMTETFAAGVWEEPSDDRRLPSVGRVDDRLMEVKVVDQGSDRELPRGEVGELLVRGEAMMAGYLDASTPTGESYVDGWFRTGDVARIDRDGYLYILDRVEYMIITGGKNVYPKEVEETIEDLDGVVNAAVVAKADERKGQKPVAFVELEDDARVSGSDVRSHCLENLAPYKHPRSVTFLDELPRNSVGKIERSALEERA